MLPVEDGDTYGRYQQRPSDSRNHDQESCPAVTFYVSRIHLQDVVLTKDHSSCSAASGRPMKTIPTPIFSGQFLTLVIPAKQGYPEVVRGSATALQTFVFSADESSDDDYVFWHPEARSTGSAECAAIA
ncbi:hypothetical protein PAXINDRAFT_8714 [Paxillus involutus ATCC 200175]|nr:hypothetical protein PAXINDRAFT_8714 [Paxillus involutus ATCC 200175]